MSKLSLWELQRAVLCWKHRFSWLCLDIFWEPGGWMLFTECYLQTCLNGLSLNSQLPWIYTLHGWGPCNKQISWICEHTMIFKVFQMLLDEINLKNRGKNININCPPCITLQGKEERSHPHEGARQCCSPSPSGVLQKSSFQVQLRPLRSTLQWESLQGKHQTTHLLQVWSLTPPPASMRCTPELLPTWNKQDHQVQLPLPSRLLENFQTAFFLIFQACFTWTLSLFLNWLWCTEWLLTKGYIPAAFQTTTLSHSDPHVYLSKHFFYLLSL